MAVPLQPTSFVNRFGSTNVIPTASLLTTTGTGGGSDVTLYDTSATTQVYNTVAGTVNVVLPLQSPSVGQVFTISNAAGGNNITIKKHATDGSGTVVTLATAKACIVVNSAGTWAQFFLQA
jgi:hypothetical protein